MDVQTRTYERALQMGYQPIAASSDVDYPPVSVTQIFDPHGHPIGGYQRIINLVDGATLAIHSDAYEMRPYDESFRSLEGVITESPLDRRDLMVKTQFSHNGGRCFRSYLFPHITVSGHDGDDIALQILAFDSYDGSYSTSIAAGGFRYICLNGNFFGRTIQQLKVRHTRNASQRFENGLTKVMDAADTFIAMQPRLRAWAAVSLDVPSFKDVLQGMPQITERLGDHLVSRYATQAEDTTLYGAWNVLTNWATYSEGTAQSRIDRDRRVAALIESRPWKRLEETA